MAVKIVCLIIFCVFAKCNWAPSVFVGFRLVYLSSKYMLTLLLQHRRRPSVEVGRDIVDAA